MNALAALLRQKIEADGPLSVATFMQTALQHPDLGYYVKAQPLGRAGDFITAPEISQMFGELVGLWCAEMWRQIGSPSAFVLLELGPGRGTLMQDALRATAKVPGFHEALQLYLLDSSEPLRAAQQEKLAAFTQHYIQDLCDLPPQPLLVIANEFFDALPIHQYRKTAEGWREIRIGWDGESFAFLEDSLPVPLPLPDTLDFYEISPQAVGLVKDLTAHLLQYGGAGLLIDYGYVVPDGQPTLQAVSGHQSVSPLERPGEVDLTALVDFAALSIAAQSQGAFVTGPVGQGEFLQTLGIELRAAQLKTRATPEQSIAIDSALQRLTDPAQMGTLFKVMAVTAIRHEEVPGFP